MISGLKVCQLIFMTGTCFSYFTCLGFDVTCSNVQVYCTMKSSHLLCIYEI